MNPYKLFIFSGLCLTLFSCKSGKLATTSVSYQSVRTVNAQPSKQHPIPAKAKIAVAYTFSRNGDLTATVFNRTSDIMIIDQTKSFFINSNGRSVSYYDPTVRTSSTTNLSSSTRGAGVNLGAVGSALGIGGAVGTLLSGVNVGGSGTKGTSTTNATYIADQPQVSLGPKSNGAMSKVFRVTGLGAPFMAQTAPATSEMTPDNSYCKFSVCITYSTDGGKSFDKLVTDFYINTHVVAQVSQKGQINDALRRVYATKPDALHENWWMLYFHNNLPAASNVYDARVQGVLYDYQ